jgi:hypothetical protein
MTAMQAANTVYHKTMLQVDSKDGYLAESSAWWQIGSRAIEPCNRATAMTGSLQTYKPCCMWTATSGRRQKARIRTAVSASK